MRVIAIEEINYDGQTYKPGDEFDTLDEQHGVLLVLGRRARQKGKLENRAMQSEAKPEPPRSNQRREYKRRDMRPED